MSPAWQRSSANINAGREVPAGPPPSPGEDLGSVTFEVQRQTRPSRRRPSPIGQWESCLEHLDERPEESATRGPGPTKDTHDDTDTRTSPVTSSRAEVLASVRRDRLGR